jgi:hydrogenase/urease accessory protein HupE
VDPRASFATRFAHPVDGIDHILAMVAVSVWGVLARSRALGFQRMIMGSLATFSSP